MLVKSLGFTIIEMMVVVAIIAILSMMALPGFQNLMINQRAAGIASRLADSLNLARMTAITMGKPVIVCPMLPGSSMQQQACLPSTNTWSAWLVFMDNNANNIDDTGEVLKYYEDIPLNTITSPTSNSVTFDAAGFVSSGSKLFTINPPGCTGKNARTIELTPSGSVYVNISDCQ
jgi:type IV fimbrial biogenesis protein FimT